MIHWLKAKVVNGINAFNLGNYHSWYYFKHHGIILSIVPLPPAKKTPKVAYAIEKNENSFQNKMEEWRKYNVFISFLSSSKKVSDCVITSA